MLSEDNIVEKSKALVWAQFKDYGSGELKILDTYLSRINARDEGSSFVTFTKKEYAELMGLDAEIRTSQLKSYTRSLLSNVVTLELPGEGYVQYSLFSEARCNYDEKRGQTIIQIDCNPKLKDVFFHLSHDGYVRYQLKNVIAMRSQYSIRLYTILKDRPFGWTVEIGELRKLIGATAETYDEFKRFNSLILKKSLEDINTSTDIIAEVQNIRKGRSVEKLKFTVKNKVSLVLPAPEMEDMPEPKEPDVPLEHEASVSEMDDDLGMFVELLPQDFTREQADLLRSLARKNVPLFEDDALPYDCRLHDYIAEKLKLMNAQKPAVKNRFAWLKRAVAEDWK